MRRTPRLLVVAMLATGLAVAGCGDDDDDDNDDTPVATQQAPATTAAAPPATAPPATTEEDGDDGDDTDTPANPNVQAAIDACKQSIDAQPTLSADVKDDLRDLCEEAASGDVDDVREASREVCRKIVEETAPAGPARETALQACDTATSG